MPVEQYEISPGVYGNAKGAADGSMFVGAQLTTIAMAARGLVAQITGYGTARVSGEPGSLLNETFETGGLDTTNRWTASGTVPPTAGVGVLALNGAQTNSATSILTSQPTFPTSSGFLLAGCSVLFDAAKVANSNQHISFGFSVAAAPTPAAPIENGYVWERDLGGDINCAVFVNSVKYIINSTDVAKITAAATIQAAFPGATASTLGIVSPAVGMTWPGGNRLLLIAQRGNLCYWYIDSFDVPVAVTRHITPLVQTLPLRVAKINAAASVLAAVNTFSSLLVGDSASQNQSLSDPIYPWRRASVSNVGALSVETINNLFNRISTATTTTVKSGAGVLRNVLIGVRSTGGTITIYDSLTGSGTVIAVIDTAVFSGELTFEVAFAIGLTLVTTGAPAADLTVTYR
jgi:hypothetical protein